MLALRNLGVDAPADELSILFDTFDTDHGGSISYKELNKQLRAGADADLSQITVKDKFGNIIDVNLAAAADPHPLPVDVAIVSGVTFTDIVARNLSCCPGCVDYGCSAKARTAGWLQAGAFSNVQGSSGVQDLTMQNVSVLAHTPASSHLQWLCSESTLAGTAGAVQPALGAGCLKPGQG